MADPRPESAPPPHPRPPMTAGRRRLIVDTLLDQQDGLVSRRQLTQAGVGREAVRWRLGRDLHVAIPGVLVRGRAPLSERQRLRAALLVGGPDARIAGEHAARRHGVTAARVPQRVDVVVPGGVASRVVGHVRVRRSRVPDRTVLRDGLPYSSGPRSVVEAAAWAADPQHARALVIEATQRRITTPTEVLTWCERLGSAGTAAVRAAAAEAADHAWSVPEADLMRLVRTSQVLPEPWANPRLDGPDGAPLTSPDLWFDDVALAVMVHSRAHHAFGGAWDDTVDADSDLVVAGVQVLGVTPTRLRDEPRQVLRRIEGAYLAARERGVRPRVQARPRRLT